MRGTETATRIKCSAFADGSAKQYTFNEKTKNARDVRAQKKNPEIEARRNAVKAEIEANRHKRQPAGSDDYANFILGGVGRRTQETYPKAKTASVKPYAFNRRLPHTEVANDKQKPSNRSSRPPR